MSWEAVEPGVYERSCDAIELLLKYVSESVAAFNREHWMVNTVAHIRPGQISDGDAIVRVRGAWIHLRYNHPFVATVLEGAHLTYRIPDGPAPKKWLAEPFLVESARTVDDFLVQIRPMTNSSLHNFPGPRSF